MMDGVFGEVSIVTSEDSTSVDEEVLVNDDSDSPGVDKLLKLLRLLEELDIDEAVLSLDVLVELVETELIEEALLSEVGLVELVEVLLVDTD